MLTLLYQDPGGIGSIGRIGSGIRERIDRASAHLPAKRVLRSLSETSVGLMCKRARRSASKLDIRIPSKVELGHSSRSHPRNPGQFDRDVLGVYVVHIPRDPQLFLTATALPAKGIGLLSGAIREVSPFNKAFSGLQLVIRQGRRVGVPRCQVLTDFRSR